MPGCASLSPVAPSLARHPAPYQGPAVSPIQTVVLDAGHGGHDPGTSHFGLREKDLTLDIARRLRVQLEGRGLTVTMTRDRDEFIELSRRPAIANRMGADLFVSVHVNANRNRQVSGIEVYYPRESRINAAGLLPPSVQPAEVGPATPTVRQILWDLVLSRTRRYSIRMAVHLCRAMRARLGTRCRGVKGARFVVLREAVMPAVLIEVGYVSNHAEASRLSSPSYREAIADGIADGLFSYVEELGLQHI